MKIHNLKANKYNYKELTLKYLVDFFGGEKKDEIESIVNSLEFQTNTVHTVEDELGTCKFIMNNQPIIKLDSTSPYTVVVEGNS